MVLPVHYLKEVGKHLTLHIQFKDYCENNGGHFSTTKYSLECTLPHKGTILLTKDERERVTALTIKDKDKNTIIDLSTEGEINCTYTNDQWFVCTAKTYAGTAYVHMSPDLSEITVRVKQPRLQLRTTHKLPK